MNDKINIFQLLQSPNNVKYTNEIPMWITLPFFAFFVTLHMKLYTFFDEIYLNNLHFEIIHFGKQPLN